MLGTLISKICRKLDVHNCATVLEELQPYLSHLGVVINVSVHA